MSTPPLRVLVLHPTFEEWGGAEWFIHRTLERFVAHRGASVRVLTHRWEAPWSTSPRYEVLQHRRGGYATRPDDWDTVARDVIDAASGCDAVWIHNHPATEWYARARRGRERSLPRAVWYCHEPPARLWALPGSTGASRHDARGAASGALGRLAAHGSKAPQRVFRAVRDRLTPAPSIDELRGSDLEAVRALDTVHANSLFTASRVRDIYGRECEIAYPITDDLAALAAPDASRDPCVLWIGRLAPAKRPELMLDAWALACETCPDLRSYRFVMVGDGPLRGEIDARRREPGRGAVELRSGLSRDDLIGLLQRALVTVQLGLAEPFGLVAVEAMACGSAVIAHAEGGALETVAHDETGWVTPIATPDDLAVLLARIPAEREALETMGRRGAQRVEALFSASRTEATIWSSLTG